jgi:hypothetical protein
MLKKIYVFRPKRERNRNEARKYRITRKCHDNNNWHRIQPTPVVIMFACLRKMRWEYKTLIGKHKGRWKCNAKILVQSIGWEETD